ncbi:MAG: inositol monophosphatase family protein [Actinomycetota bacterium]|uniref:inositol monophosphatase family protein n=1 Tax=Micrococcaceae TaxID=1268 RepID=UPI0024BA79E0|nr:inositol monophosphatase family protein [Paenarthrobacter sp. PH39-S1]MDJ0354625.1 inositol monophosphatase family protein [Paenarthrobacter sp. PH39-S1]MDQ6740067.1 inositol monophosphatase family protein [Actinomycetota bacterium]
MTSESASSGIDPALSDMALAAALVRRAGHLAHSMRSGGLLGEQKTSVSDVVTAADRAAENFIVEQLRRCRPEDGILGEEGAAHAGVSGRTWVIDPVDGTYNFLSGSTYWCSALALKPGGSGGGTHSGGGTGSDGTGPDPDVLLGAIYQPEGDKLWLGGAEHPATLNGRPTSPPSNSALGRLSAGTYIHPSWLVQPQAAMPWHAAAVLPATIRMLGSGSCDLGHVADGQLGCWFQHSCPEWDWLPGKAIVLAGGGATAVVRVNGLNWFIAGGTTAVREVAAALRSVALG